MLKYHWTFAMHALTVIKYGDIQYNSPTRVRDMDSMPSFWLKIKQLQINYHI